MGLFDGGAIGAKSASNAAIEFAMHSDWCLHDTESG